MFLKFLEILNGTVSPISWSKASSLIVFCKDKSVPINYSRKVLKIFRNAQKKLVIVKNGDHSLSSPKWLNLIQKELKIIINWPLLYWILMWLGF